LWIMNDLFELVSVLTRAVQKCAHAEVSSHWKVNNTPRSVDQTRLEFENLLGFVDFVQYQGRQRVQDGTIVMKKRIGMNDWLWMNKEVIVRNTRTVLRSCRRKWLCRWWNWDVYSVLSKWVIREADIGERQLSVYCHEGRGWDCKTDFLGGICFQSEVLNCR
jgi:hypothetical protein